MLNGLKSRVASETGEELNVGNLPDVEEMETDNREPAELLARIIAHLFHRTPGIRNIEKRLEGQDSSSGIGSDVIAFFIQLYYGNKHVWDSMMNDAKERAVAKKMAKESNVPGMNGMHTYGVPEQEVQQ